MHHHCSHPPRNAAGRRRQAGDQDLAGTTTLRVRFSTAAKKQLAGSQRLNLFLVVTAEDAADNSVTRRVMLRARR